MGRDSQDPAIEARVQAFEAEREEIRKLLEQIGSKPRFGNRLANLLFLVLIFGCFAVSIITRGEFRLVSIEIGVVALAVKFIYYFTHQARVAHYQFWMLSSIELRLSDLAQDLRQLSAKLSVDGKM
jgi:hypothetical protein